LRQRTQDEAAALLRPGLTSPSL